MLHYSHFFLTINLLEKFIITKCLYLPTSNLLLFQCNLVLVPQDCLWKFLSRGSQRFPMLGNPADFSIFFLLCSTDYVVHETTLYKFSQSPFQGSSMSSCFTCHILNISIHSCHIYIYLFTNNY